jgi:cytochrome c5
MKKLIVILIAISIFAACKASKKTTSDITAQKALNCPDKELTFNNDIKQIFEKNCTKCHNKNERAGYNFHKLEFVRKAAQSGKLLGAIKHMKGYQPMPRYTPFLKRAAQLDQEYIDKIECWIKSGMKE